MATTARTIDAKQAIGIINSRIPIGRESVGQQIVAQVQGNATFVSALDQQVKNPGQAAYFDKNIYNLKANSKEAMGRAENKQLLKEGMVAESTGNVELATEKFNAYLNAIQVSFNQIAQPGRRVLQDGDMVTCVVGESDTKAGHKAITVDNIRYKAPVSIDKVKFSLLDLLGEDTTAPATTGAPVTTGLDN